MGKTAKQRWARFFRENPGADRATEVLVGFTSASDHTPSMASVARVSGGIRRGVLYVTNTRVHFSVSALSGAKQRTMEFKYIERITKGSSLVRNKQHLLIEMKSRDDLEEEGADVDMVAGHGWKPGQTIVFSLGGSSEERARWHVTIIDLLGAERLNDTDAKKEVIERVVFGSIISAAQSAGSHGKVDFVEAQKREHPTRWGDIEEMDVDTAGDDSDSDTEFGGGSGIDGGGGGGEFARAARKVTLLNRFKNSKRDLAPAAAVAAAPARVKLQEAEFARVIRSSTDSLAPVYSSAPPERVLRAGISDTSDDGSGAVQPQPPFETRPNRAESQAGAMDDIAQIKAFLAEKRRKRAAETGGGDADATSPTSPELPTEMRIGGRISFDEKRLSGSKNRRMSLPRKFSLTSPTKEIAGGGGGGEGRMREGSISMSPLQKRMMKRRHRRDSQLRETEDSGTRAARRALAESMAAQPPGSGGGMGRSHTLEDFDAAEAMTALDAEDAGENRMERFRRVKRLSLDRIEVNWDDESEKFEPAEEASDSDDGSADDDDLETSSSSMALGSVMSKEDLAAIIERRYVDVHRAKKKAAKEKARQDRIEAQQLTLPQRRLFRARASKELQNSPKGSVERAVGGRKKKKGRAPPEMRRMQSIAAFGKAKWEAPEKSAAAGRFSSLGAAAGKKAALAASAAAAGGSASSSSSLSTTATATASTTASTTGVSSVETSSRTLLADAEPFSRGGVFDDVVYGDDSGSDAEYAGDVDSDSRPPSPEKKKHSGANTGRAAEKAPSPHESSPVDGIEVEALKTAKAELEARCERQSAELSALRDEHAATSERLAAMLLKLDRYAAYFVNTEDNRRDVHGLYADDADRAAFGGSAESMVAPGYPVGRVRQSTPIVAMLLYFNSIVSVFEVVFFFFMMDLLLSHLSLLSSLCVFLILYFGYHKFNIESGLLSRWTGRSGDGDEGSDDEDMRDERSDNDTLDASLESSGGAMPIDAAHASVASGASATTTKSAAPPRRFMVGSGRQRLLSARRRGSVEGTDMHTQPLPPDEVAGMYAGLSAHLDRQLSLLAEVNARSNLFYNLCIDTSLPTFMVLVSLLLIVAFVGDMMPSLMAFAMFALIYLLKNWVSSKARVVIGLIDGKMKQIKSGGTGGGARRGKGKAKGKAKRKKRS